MMRPAGVICPMVTPTAASGQFNRPVAQALIDALVPDVDGLFVLGSSGELPWLSAAVADDVAATAIDRVRGRVPVYVGVGDTSTARTADRLNRAAGAGADVVVIAGPHYYPVTSDAHLRRHFEGLADRSPVPVLLYNIPQNVGISLSPALVGQLAQHPNIAGIKDSSGDMFAFTAYLRHRSPAFSVLQGREQLMAVSYWLGADGIVSTLANFAPRLLAHLGARMRHGEFDAARATQSVISDAAGIFDEGYWLAAMKAAVTHCGFAVGPPLSPQAEVTAAQREAIASRLAALDGAWLTVGSCR